MAKMCVKLEGGVARISFALEGCQDCWASELPFSGSKVSRAATRQVALCFLLPPRVRAFRVLT